jgi:hypothetical protein
LFALETLSHEHRLQLLPEAVRAAEAAGVSEVLGVWKQELEALKPKPTPAPKQ